MQLHAYFGLTTHQFIFRIISCKDKVYNMLKSTLFASAMLLAATPACRAQHVNSMVVAGSTGEKTFALSDIKRISLNSDAMTIVSRAADSQTFAFTDVRKVFFTAATTGIGQLSKTTAPAPTALRLSADGTTLSVEGWDKTRRTTVDIFTVNGVKVSTFANWNGADIDIATLAHGVYIVRIGDKAAKFNK